MEMQSLKNLTAMLEARGDDTTSLKEQAQSLDSPSFYGDAPLELFSDHTHVFYCLTKDILKKLIKDLKEMEADDMITQWGVKQFIVIEKPSQTSLAVLEEMDKRLLGLDGQLQIFDIRNLLFNPATHIYTPKHEKMTDAEIKVLLDQYNVKSRSQLPIILKSDVMARWLGLRHGDVVRIHRTNPNSGEALFYRYVV